MKRESNTIQWLVGVLLMVVLTGSGMYFGKSTQLIPVSPELAQRIWRQIWQNECGGKLEGLTSWNEREEFASLGIGHFIWYPESQRGAFKESFPALLRFFISHRVAVPGWLTEARGCPWKTREEFLLAQNQEQMKELRELLALHIDVQIQFMVQRLQKALPTMVKHVPRHRRYDLNYQFYRMARTDEGIYALLDYLNFKGEGVADTESYQGKRWGLLQVLEKMRGLDHGPAAIEEFVVKAKEVLAARVASAPLERQEERWLKGWMNRLDTYSKF